MTPTDVRTFLKFIGGSGKCLSYHEAQVVSLWYGLDGCVVMTGSEVARSTNRDLKSVRRLERQAVEKLAEKMNV